MKIFDTQFNYLLNIYSCVLDIFSKLYITLTFSLIYVVRTHNNTSQTNSNIEQSIKYKYNVSFKNNIFFPFH